jgi:serine protease SohB
LATLKRYLPARFRGAPTVPVVRLAGVVGSVPFRGRGLTLQALERAIDAAFALKGAPAVALVVNSPGGSPVQASLLARRIRDLAAEKERRVLAFVEEVAASGGYWIALAADEILVDASSIVGSIGVISAGFGLQDTIARLGIERRVEATGARKGMLDPFRPQDEADRAVIRAIQADIFEGFKAWVRERRGPRLSLPEAELFDGRVWSGTRAVEHGLADGLGELRSTVRARFGKEARLRLMNQPRGWLARRLGGGSEPSGMAGELLAALDELALRRRVGL